jgi:hypothetical protein
MSAIVKRRFKKLVKCPIKTKNKERFFKINYYFKIIVPYDIDPGSTFVKFY